MTLEAHAVVSCSPSLGAIPMPAFGVPHYFEQQTPSNPNENGTAAGVQFLRHAKLRVQEGAGLLLYACNMGFLVQEIDDTPGQPDLRLKDVIVAIQGSLLCGLDEDEIQDRFGAAFQDGAPLLVGASAHLAQLQPEELQQAVQHMISPVAVQVPSVPEALATCAMNPGLCPDDADDGVVVRADGSGAACSLEKSKWSGVRGRPGVLKGRYQYEIELEEACLLRVGFSGITSRRTVGKDARSFGYGGTGMKSNAGQFEQYGAEFSETAKVIVTCLMDRSDTSRQTISFCLNGVNQGVAFEIPEELIDVPLFPILCGRGSWRATCRFSRLVFPADGYAPLNQALAAGHAILGPKSKPELPRGLPVQEAHTLVKPGQRVTLYVVSGAWEGWHTCEVLDTDALGCYLRHEEDGFTETIPWMFLKTRYRMELLNEIGAQNDDGRSKTKLQEARDQFQLMQSLLFKVADQLPEHVLQAIDSKLTSRQKAFIIWLTAKCPEDRPELTATCKGLAGSKELKQWLETLQFTMHSSVIEEWCDRQGAICLSEIIENRDDLIADLGPILSCAERTQLLSQVAVEAAEMVTFHSQRADMVELLGAAIQELDKETFECIHGSLSSEGKHVLHSARQPAEETRAAHSEARKTSSVMLTCATNISKADRKLISQLGTRGSSSLLGGVERCAGCGEESAVGRGQVCEEDGSFYCGCCWKDWLRMGADINTEGMSPMSSLISVGGA
jgi:hypothetical protein